MGLGVYAHLAFCPYLCPYCDFAKWPYRASKARAYLAALDVELETLEPQPAATIFLGGGTPNAYAAADLTALVERLRRHFPAERDPREVTVELNPELVRDGDMERYVAAGVTRVSIGVQSFDEGEIRVLGRGHTIDDVERAVRSARAAGVTSVSLDLIFAVPGQTARSWSDSLERAIALGVDHVSTYGLTVEEGTPYAAWQAREPARFFDDVAEAELYDIAIERLEQHGYEQYEISNFARPQHRCAHNENYWANGDYVGIGVGAASYSGGERRMHTRDLDEYVAAASAHLPIPGQSERLDAGRRAGEAIMLALRTSQGLGLRAFKDRYGVDVLARYGAAVQRYATEGLLEWSEDSVRLTRRGRFVANDICAAFLEVPVSA
jgi:oxygen-independent coproporphyrinogen-3 oxidase